MATPGGLGRRAAEDTRDLKYLLRAAMVAAPKAPKPRTKPYQLGPILDQGQTGRCVGYAWAQKIQSAPILVQRINPVAIYDLATELDEWPGEHDPNSGTSGRAGAKALRQMGRLSEWHNCYDAQTLADWLTGGWGTACLGINWYEGFDTPTHEGLVAPGGSIRGGHEVFNYWYDQVQGVFWFCNSWGPDWGLRGTFRMTGETVDRLLAEGGDCIAATEIKKR